MPPRVAVLPEGEMLFSTEMMIDMIKEHSILFDKGHLQYKNTHYKDRLFDKIGKDLGGVSGTYTCLHFLSARQLFCGGGFAPAGYSEFRAQK